MVDNTTLSFQLVSWYAQDVECEDEDDIDTDNDPEPTSYKPKRLKYAIKLFGRDKAGTSVSCTVADFTPYFFVKLQGDRNWTNSDIVRFTEAVYKKLNKPWLQDCIHDARVMKRKDFWGFSNDKQFNFLRLCFSAERHMKQVAKSIATSTFFIPGISQRTFPLYESNIAPFLRFAHIQGIAPAGWVTIPRKACDYDTVQMPSKCAVDFQCFWKHVTGDKERTDMAPLKIAAFDIECVSSDMDFPVAKKNYVKVASDVVNMTNSGKFTNATEWKSEVVKIVLEKFDSKAMLPFKPISRPGIEDTLLKHGDHIMLIVNGDKTIVDNIMRKFFEEAGFQPTTLAAFVSFVDKISKTATSVTATRLAMGTWLRKAFAKQPNTSMGRSVDVEAAIGRIISLHMREKDAIVNVLTTYLDGILPPVRGDEIIQIGITTHRYGDTNCSEKVMVSLGTCDPIPGVVVVECSDERDLLHKWVDVMAAMDPDICCGYNIFGFDFKFIQGRAEELGCTSKMEELSRLIGREYPAEFKEARLSSSALGDNVMYFFDMPGRTCMDLMKVIQRDYKLDSYKLDTVANHFMGMNKKDVSPADIFRLAKGTSADRAIVADYCIQDCELCNHLVMKLEIVANNAGMASVCSVPLHYIFMRGQGVKIFSLVAKMCRELGYVVPTLQSPDQNDEQDNDGYEGAIVLEPKTGMYIHTPVAVLDYASLYPSSMISENLSHDCIVLDDRYDNLPDIVYKDVSYDIYEGSGEEKVKVGERTCRYAHKSTGVIPYILKDLLQARKRTRKRMAHKRAILRDGTVVLGVWDAGTSTLTTEDGRRIVLDNFSRDVKDLVDAHSPFEKATLDGLQLAYKITANSLYGQVGSKTSPIYLKDIAACTTATGRRMILLAKDFLETNYDANIIYGDSVPGYTPCIIRVDKTRIEVAEIEDVARKYGCSEWRTCIENKSSHQHNQDPKEAIEVANVETWTSEGWTPLQRVIRHVLAKHKSIIRVCTPCGVVDVTDDHSLITADGAIVSPVDLEIGDHLLGNFIRFDPPQEMDAYFTEDQARLMGMLMLAGIIDDNKHTVQVFGMPHSLMDGYKTIGKRAYPQVDWVVKNMISTSDSCVFGTSGEGVEGGNFITTLKTTYPTFATSPCVPTTILNAPYKIRRAFWNGVLDGCAGGTIMAGTQLAACSLMLLMRSIDLVPWLDTSTITICGEVRYAVHHDAFPHAPFGVRKLAKTPCKGAYVYDLTTNNHQFQAGAGFLVVHNTDSLFVHFPKQMQEKRGKEALQITIDTAITASDAIKPLLPSPHDLEYEKTYWPFILFSKKRYVANQYGADVNKFKQSSMGIVLKRRDNAQIVKIIYGGVIDIILNSHDVPASIDFLRVNLNDLAEGKRALEDLIISKSLKAHYKDPSRIAHKVLADRIKERNPGNAPQVNDRIPYVYVVSQQTGKVLQGDKIEHPDFIRESELIPDYEFYITNQIMKPVLQLYALVLEQLPGYNCERGHWARVTQQLVSEGKSTRFIKEKVRDMREMEVKKLLFDPVLKRIRQDPSMIALKNKRDGNRTITDWFGPITKKVV